VFGSLFPFCLDTKTACFVLDTGKEKGQVCT